MVDKSLELLNEEELQLLAEFENCETMEELISLRNKAQILTENSNLQYKHINMSVEDFKREYDLTDIDDLNGNYGF